MPNINEFMGRVLRNGVQRTNQYLCKLDLTQFRPSPTPFGGAFGLKGADGTPNAIEMLKEGLLCRTTMTPSREIVTTSVDLAIGYDESYANSTTYAPLNCVFLCPLIAGTNPVLTLFHAWQNYIQNRGEVGEDDTNMVFKFPDGPNGYRLKRGLRLELLSGGGPTERKTTELTNRLGEDRLGPIETDFRSGVNKRVPSAITTAFEYFDVYPTNVAGTTVDWSVIDEMMEVAVTFSYTHWKIQRQARQETLLPATQIPF